ncbi:DEK domain-containing chromatin-associated protein 1-like [Impatiens glandulifera]|uniref:DEK domain-containing chromatin-associated protein 1-like n=1 Tax=Impatiens glandulifera TaxID=253017 RepID=UPI001FB04F3E|nr:DEK domain-containing chromatin-associated protein 1-like [Impatiens glandulifera]
MEIETQTLEAKEQQDNTAADAVQLQKLTDKEIEKGIEDTEAETDKKDENEGEGADILEVKEETEGKEEGITVKRGGKGRSKNSSKSSALEKVEDETLKEPVTPHERPTRERKTVQRFSVPQSARSVTKVVSIEKGKGTPLKDIPNVAYKLSKRKPDDNLQILHSVLFGKKTKTHTLKKNIGQFSGFVWIENEEKQKGKVKERLDKCVKEKLLDFCDVLNIPINKTSAKKEEVSIKLLEFLESPYATTDTLLAEKEQKSKKRKAKGTKSRERLPKKTKVTETGDKDEQMSEAEKDGDDEDEAVPSDNSSDSEGDAEKNQEQESDDVSKSEGKEEGSEEDDEVDEKPEKELSSEKKTTKKTLKEPESKASGKPKPAKEDKSSKSPRKSTKKKHASDDEEASGSASKLKVVSANKRNKVDKEDTKSSVKEKGTRNTKQSKKVLTKDQGKGKAGKKSKLEPMKEEIHSAVEEILKEVDFNTATLSDIIKLLGKQFGVDLTHRKAEVKEIITEVINNMSGDEEEEEEDGDDDDDDDGGDSN